MARRTAFINFKKELFSSGGAVRHRSSLSPFEISNWTPLPPVADVVFVAPQHFGVFPGFKPAVFQFIADSVPKGKVQAAHVNLSFVFLASLAFLAAVGAMTATGEARCNRLIR